MSLLTQAKVVPRADWGAAEPKDIVPLESPIKYISLSYVGPPKVLGDEMEVVREIQRFNFAEGFKDIQSNFIIGKLGTIYEGRGWHANTEIGENSTSRQNRHKGQYLEVTYIGNYLKTPESNPLLKATGELIREGVRRGLLHERFAFLEDYVNRGGTTPVTVPDYRSGHEDFNRIQQHLYNLDKPK